MKKTLRILLYLMFVCKATYSQLPAQKNLLELTKAYSVSDPALAIIYADSCVQVAKKQSDDRTLGEVYKRLGVIYYLGASYELAYANYILSIQAFEKATDSVGMASTMLELGNFYIKKKQFKVAKEYCLFSIRLATKYRDDFLLANAYNSMGIYYESMHVLDSALVFYQKSYEKNESLRDALGMSYSLEYMAGIQKLRFNYTESLQLLMRSAEIRRKIDNKSALATSYVNIGELYLAKEEHAKAKNYFDLSLALAKQVNYKDLIAYDYQMISNCYKDDNNFKGAYTYQDSSQKVQRDIDNEFNSKQLKEFQTKYETEKKEKQIEYQDLELSKSNILLNRNRIAIYSLIGLVLVLIVIFYLSYARYKLKQQTLMNKKLLDEQQSKAKAILDAEEKERQRIGKDLHDGIGQMLSAVKLNISGLSKSITNEDSSELNLLKNSMKLIDESVVEVRNISHNMMPTVLLEFGLIQALSDMCTAINNSALVHIHFIHDGLEIQRLPINLEIVLYRVLQEILNNTLKHAAASKIDLQLLKFDGELTVVFEDNGVGFNYQSVSASPNGIGLRNIISRVEYLNGSVNFDSYPGKGTTITIEIPLNDFGNG